MKKIVKRLALVAHDNCKQSLGDWCLKHRAILATMDLCATGTTGVGLKKILGQDVECFSSGPLGGDMQIAAKVVQGDIDALIFFWDPLSAQPHDPDVKALLRLVTVWNIPTACNVATADMLIVSPLIREGYEVDRRMVDHYMAGR